MSETEVEEWRPIPGWEGFYDASTLGRIKSLERRTTSYRGFTRRVRECILKPNSLSGYPTLGLSANGRSKTYRVHRLVLLAFVGPCPPGHEACHEDNDRENARLSNLRWDTRVSNMADRIKHGTSNRGARNARIKLTEADVHEIRRRLKAGENRTSISASFGVKPNAVSKIKSGENWAWLKKSKDSDK